MANTALNRTTQVLGTNKSGGALNYGDVVVLDNTNDNGFTTTTSAGLSTRGLGVILEPNGIANNASGMIAVGGWCPKINLNTSATDGQFIKTHTVAGQGTPHASPQVEGDFAVALTASATPAAILFGSPNGPGGSGGTPGGSNTQVQYNNSGAFGGITGATTDGTTLILVAPVLGTPASATLTNATGLPTAGLVNSAVTLAKIQNASASSKLLGSGASGSGSSYSELTLGIGLSMSGTTLSAAGVTQIQQIITASSQTTVDFTSIPGTYTSLMLVFQTRDTASGNSQSSNRIRINNDSTSGDYVGAQRIIGEGSTFAGSVAASSNGGFICPSPNDGNTAGIVGQCTITIHNYSGSTFHKRVQSLYSSDWAAASSVGSYNFRWASTAAVTRVTVTTDGTAFKDGLVFTLYGLA